MAEEIRQQRRPSNQDEVESADHAIASPTSVCLTALSLYVTSSISNPTV